MPRRSETPAQPVELPAGEVVLPDRATNQTGAEESQAGTTAWHVGISRSTATSVPKMTLSLA